MGVDTRTLKDVNGKAFGQELYELIRSRKVKSLRLATCG